MRPHGTAICARCATVFQAAPSQKRVYCSGACYRATRADQLPDRFWSKVEKTERCWLWTAAISKRHGYGEFCLGMKTERASRIAWMLASGAPVPTDMDVCHTCDIRPCVRNDDHGSYVVNGIAYERRGHLFLAPTQGNATDMAEKGRSTRGERNAQAKLTADQVRRMRALYAAGTIMQKELAAQFGVSPACVRTIVTGRHWKHL
jgi:hypothetical protein